MNFSKIQATGNDFVLLNIIRMERDWSDLARKMCHRHLGIGADGLITVNKKDSRLIMRIFNADGTEAEVCGNGLRCFAKYVIDYGIKKKPDMEIHTSSGIKYVHVYKSKGKVNRVKVNMGRPKFSAREIPVRINKGLEKSILLDIMSIIEQQVTAENEQLTLNLLSMGNPHAISYLNIPVEKYALDRIGPVIEYQNIFPQRINFEVARVIGRDIIEARVWERGVGETMACGSGACAIAVASILKGYVGNHVNIKMPGGMLYIDWDGKGDVFLTGEVKEVFVGKWLGNK